MSSCMRQAILPRKARAGEVIYRLSSGVPADDVYKDVHEVHQCSRRRHHKGAHDFRTYRWLMTRSIVRVVVAFVIAVFVVAIGSLDMMSLH